ncbi:MAG: flagellar motor protein MotA [Magnetospiraceae bacterium]
MTEPKGYLIRMALFIAVVLALGVFLMAPLQEAFTANVALNGLILGVLLLGIIYNFRQVARLMPEVHWLEAFDDPHASVADMDSPSLLGPFARMVGDRRDRVSLSAMATRSLLDGISSRLDESRDISRYTIGLLIFLGLLGTFWGLLQTVGAIAGVIGNLQLTGSDMAAVFEDLKTGLAAPLDGMGTAFSSSLFGLAGSLVLGFLDLQAGQAQNRFFNELEDGLSSLTKLGSGPVNVEGGDLPIPYYVQALLEQTAENLETLQRTLARGEEGRLNANHNIAVLADKLGQLTDQMQAQQEIMSRLAASQTELRPVFTALADSLNSGGIDEASRTHIRNIDIHLARLAEDAAIGREDMVQQLRSELKLLARTVAALGQPGE